MFTTENITLITQITSLAAIAFGGYLYFKDPQVDMEKKQLIDEKVEEKRAAILAQQFESEKESVERRFEEMGKRLAEGVGLAQNHIHTVDTKVDNLTELVRTMNLQMTSELTRLSTIIEERIPKQ